MTAHQDHRARRLDRARRHVARATIALEQATHELDRIAPKFRDRLKGSQRTLVRLHHDIAQAMPPAPSGVWAARRFYALTDA